MISSKELAYHIEGIHKADYVCPANDTDWSQKCSQ